MKLISVNVLVHRPKESQTAGKEKNYKYEYQINFYQFWLHYIIIQSFFPFNLKTIWK